MTKYHCCALPILALMAAATLFITGCVVPAPYQNTGFSPASIARSDETLNDTFPEVILSIDTQVTRKYLNDFAKRTIWGFDTRDLDSAILFDELRRVLLEHFGPNPKPQNGQEADFGTDIRMIYDAKVVLGPLSGKQTTVSLTAVFIDSRQVIVDTVKGEGVSTVPYPASSFLFHEAAKVAFADFVRNLQAAPALAARKEQQKKLTEEQHRHDFALATDQDDGAKVLFKLQPEVGLSVAQVTEILITWKNRHLDNVLRNSQTAELRDYVDQIEHTIFQATDVSEKEKDDAQRLVAAGVNDEHEHTDLARAYRLRIEVLKPILTAFKEEVANRGK